VGDDDVKEGGDDVDNLALRQAGAGFHLGDELPLGDGGAEVRRGGVMVFNGVGKLDATDFELDPRGCVLSDGWVALCLVRSNSRRRVTESVTKNTRAKMNSLLSMMFLVGRYLPKRHSRSSRSAVMRARNVSEAARTLVFRKSDTDTHVCSVHHKRHAAKPRREWLYHFGYETLGFVT
jgi:hypothetical protein